MSIKIEAMQYQVTCKQCHQLYVVDTNPGTTIRSRCPYCGTVATISTPILGQQDTKSSGPVSPQRPKTKPAPSYSPLSSSSHPSSPTPSSPPHFFAHPSGRGAVLCRRNPPPYLGYFPLLCLQGNEHVAILFPFVRRPPRYMRYIPIWA